MRVTKRQLRRIIREEKRKVLAENRVRRLVRRALREQEELEEAGVMDPTTGEWIEDQPTQDQIDRKKGRRRDSSGRPVEEEEGGETKKDTVSESTWFIKRQLRKIIRESLNEAMPKGGVPDVVGAVTGVYGEKNRRGETSYELEMGVPSEFVEANWEPWLDARGLLVSDLDDLAHYVGAPDRSWLDALPPANGMMGPADIEQWAEERAVEIELGASS